MNFTITKNTTEPIVLTESGKYTVELTEPGAHAQVVGKFLTREKEIIDIELFIIHKAPHTTAQTTLKGVAKDQSHIRFFGRIIIEKNCGNTQSFLEERILLLSDQAKAEAIPELEILSDDVKCSHAATISRIPEEHLFYLQSRGVAREQAEELVIEGFLE
jgi:Fe-S cluster assembly protein SufD